MVKITKRKKRSMNAVSIYLAVSIKNITYKKKIS